MSFMSLHCGLLLLLVALGVLHAEGIGVEARATHKHSSLVRKEDGQVQGLKDDDYIATQGEDDAAPKSDGGGVPKSKEKESVTASKSTTKEGGKASKGKKKKGGGDIDFLCEDAVSAHTMCKMLSGTNTQVQGKLEQAIAALNIEDEATENVVTISKDEDGQMKELKNDLWTLYFCSKKKNPPCIPKKSEDPAIKDARNRARVSLTALEADDATSKNTAQKAYLKSLKKLGQPAPKAGSLK